MSTRVYFLLAVFLLAPLSLVACSSSLSQDALNKDLVTIPELGDRTPSVTNTAIFAPKTPSIRAPNEVTFNLWWRYTGNKELAVLIDRAITNSQMLQIAAQRVVQAKARFVQSGAQNMPTINAQAGYNIETPTNGIGSVPAGSKPKGKGELEIGLTGSYTLDLWGQRKSLAQSADLKLKQAVFQYDAQLLELISQLSKNYFEYLSLNDRIKNTQETEQALTAMLLAMEDRYRLGDATIVELQIQRSSVYSSRLRLPTLLKDRQQLKYEIAHLMGISPDYLELSNLGLASVSLPQDVQGISTAHLLRRPDIRTIESGMLAADADLDVARKALLPGLTLVADISSGVHSPADLFQPNTLVWNFLSTLSATVFDGGAKEQEVKYAQAVRNELIESYVNTVHNGLRAARSAITELEFSGERLAIQQESATAAKIAQDFGFDSYAVGGIDFLTFLNSTQSYQERQDSVYQFELEYYQAFVDFYSALGGGIPYREISAHNPVFKASEDLATKLEESVGWLDKPKEFTDSPWLVKLAGVFDRFAIEALMRDLPRRYTNLQPAKTLIVEKVGVDIPTPANDAVWYSVNFTGFEQEQDAVAWCQMLRSVQQRCVIYQPVENFEYVGLFNIADIEQRADRLDPALFANALAAEPNAWQTLNKTAADNTTSFDEAASLSFGQRYSLLNMAANQAWLIDNQTYQVQRISLGETLELGGVLTSLDADHAVINFQNKDYLLYPLYRVASVEAGPDGQIFARMHWGRSNQEVYHYRIGDSLHGGGIINLINPQQVGIDWQGKQILLPILN